MARGTIRDWSQVTPALRENGVSQSDLGRYYGYDRRQVNNLILRSVGIALPDSKGIYKAIDDIKRGVLRDPEAE